MKITHRNLTVLVLLITLLLTLCSGCGKKEKTDKDRTDTQAEPSSSTNIIATVTSRELNLRSTPSYNGTILKTLKKGDTVTILERTEVDGVSWGKTEKGWICLLYVTIEEISTENQELETFPSSPATLAPVRNEGVVIVSILNIRSGPDTANEKIGEYTWEEKIEILEEKNGWARTDKGWISLSYVYREDNPDMEPLTVKILASELNIRQGPSVGYKSIAKAGEGETTIIFKQFVDNLGECWGYNGTGWINMKWTEQVN